jgi:signal transduction histidine kinase
MGAMMEGDPRDASGRFTALGAVSAERSRWQRRASLLSEVIGAFAEATIDYERLLDVITRKVADVVGDMCSVLLLSEDGQTLALAAAHARDPDTLALTRATYASKPLVVAPVQQKVLDTGEAYFAPCMSPERMRDTASEKTVEFTDRIGMHSMVMVEVRDHDQAIGELALVRYSPEQPPFDDHDRELAQLLADHIGVAIGKARGLRRHQRQLVLAKEAAEGANHELEAFSYSAAHDLRAPLRVIERFATALESDYSARLDDDGRHYLGRVQCASRRMTHLIDDLLTLSRITHGTLRRERVDLSDMARKIMFDLFGRSSARKVEARVHDGLHTTADRGLLQVLLENLLDNAWKFTGHRPSATIELGCAEDGAPSVFFVRDNGAGFDMKYAERLFRPFQRLHSSSEFEGSGIGLATVHRIIGRHGGRVWVESQPERGTTVYFTVDEQG